MLASAFQSWRPVALSRARIELLSSDAFTIRALCDRMRLVPEPQRRLLDSLPTPTDQTRFPSMSKASTPDLPKKT